MIESDQLVHSIIDYAVTHQLITTRDILYHQNRLLAYLQLHTISKKKTKDIELQLRGLSIQQLLDEVQSFAIDSGLLVDPTLAEVDQFLVGAMGCITMAPSQLECLFWQYYDQSPKKATDFYYRYVRDNYYVRENQMAKNKRWQVDSSYGRIDISINLSKPEKDPRDIAKAGQTVDSNYPTCLLCIENEGYPGRQGHPARQNHRLIQVKLDGENWYLQYSPYGYYNEHSIVLNEKHTPMHIDQHTFEKMVDFVDCFPHYFVGSNADLPIVGGSILSHDHFQAGRYCFPMDRASSLDKLVLKRHPVTVERLHWPLSVLRLTSKDRSSLIECATTILQRWRRYEDRSLEIIAATGKENHNTLTPILKKKNNQFELDLALRNNRTSEKHPYGIFHPHEDKHYIKKENIGLIEVMGLAILPARLMQRFDTKKVDQNQVEREIGSVFVACLEDAGVFKQNDQGREGFLRAREALCEGL